MGSSYFGDPNMGNDRKPDGGSNGGGSTRRGKKGGSDKPKQPQRGLGVAQLEKIRLHGQLGSSNFHPSLHNPYPSSLNQDDIRAQATAAAAYSTFPSSSFSYPPSSSSSATSYGYNPHFLMGNDYEKASIRYDDAQPTNNPSWIPGNASNVLEFPQYMRPTTPTQNLLNFSLEADSQEKNDKNHRSGSIGSCSQNSEDQELDLELRLSR